MNWYYIPEEDDTYLYICPCKKGRNRWLCVAVDWDGDFQCFIDMPARYMVKKWIRQPKKKYIYRVIIEYGAFGGNQDFSEYL